MKTAVLPLPPVPPYLSLIAAVFSHRVDDVVKRLLSLEMANKVSGLCQALTSLRPLLETPSYPGNIPQPMLLKSKYLSHYHAVSTCQYPRLSISRARTEGTTCSLLYP